MWDITWYLGFENSVDWIRMRPIHMRFLHYCLQKVDGRLDPISHTSKHKKQKLPLTRKFGMKVCLDEITDFFIAPRFLVEIIARECEDFEALSMILIPKLRELRVRHAGLASFARNIYDESD